MRSSGVAHKGLQPSLDVNDQDAVSIGDESPVEDVKTAVPEPDPVSTKRVDRVDSCDPEVQESRLVGADESCEAADDITAERLTMQVETAQMMAQACRRDMVSPGRLMSKTLTDETI